MTTVRRCSTHALRNQFRLTQEELAELFEIPVSTVRNWDARKSCPHYMLCAMWEALIRGYGMPGSFDGSFCYTNGGLI